jgi:hypothetical protein
MHLFYSVLTAGLITDAVSANGKIVLEVEVGRACVGKQFLRDVF